MKWEEDLEVGSKYLNKNLREVTNDGVSIEVNHWGAAKDHTFQENHSHEYYEVCFVMNGKGVYTEGSEREEIKKGTLILSQPKTLHQLYSEKGLDFVLIGFNLQSTSHSYIQKLFHTVNDHQLYVMHHKENAAAILLWLSILKLAAQENTIYLKNNITSLAITLFWSVLKEFEKDALSSVSNQARTSAANLIYRAKVYIINHLSEKIKINQVANHLHISERHMSRIFKQELGQSFSTYIRKERIRKAGILLSDSNIPIKDIAQQTGFSSVHYFTNVFSKEMDMPPGEFRDKFRYKNPTTH